MKRIITGALAALLSLSALAATTIPVQSLTPTGSTAGQAVVSTGPTSLPAWGNVTATALAAQAANTVVANITASSASPTAVAIPTCNTSTSALQYTPVTGLTCYTSSAATTGTLAQFAATTSAQLAGVLSDETGTGSVVFSNSPTLTGTLTVANVTASGTLTGFAGRLLNIRFFSAGGTYTPTTGTAAVYVKVQGGGGAGGGTPVTNASQVAAGSGGSAGAYAEAYYTSGFSGATLSIGAGGTGSSGANGGAGGTTSFGALLSCPGGPGGLAGSAATTTFVTGTGGNTAACTGTALMSRIGQQGAQSMVIGAGPVSVSGGGGASTFGASAGIWNFTVGVVGQLGAGGSGANAGISSAAQPGAAGGAGYIEVFEFSQ